MRELWENDERICVTKDVYDTTICDIWHDSKKKKKELEDEYDRIKYWIVNSKRKNQKKKHIKKKKRYKIRNRNRYTNMCVLF